MTIRPERHVGLREGFAGVLSALALTGFMAFAGSTSATAQTVCLTHDSLEAQLGKRFKESQSAVAIDSKGSLVHLYTNPEKQTWTIVLTKPGGPSCIVASGTDWTDLPSFNDDQVALLPDDQG